MSNEELEQRGYLIKGKVQGARYGSEFEELNIGATTIGELKKAGIEITIPDSIDFPFKFYKFPKKPISAKPDRVFVQKKDGQSLPIAVAEHKAMAKRRTEKDHNKTAEQALYSAAAMSAAFAIYWKDEKTIYIDVRESIKQKKLIEKKEVRDLSPSVLLNLLAGDIDVAKDPAALAESVWQLIWHSTKEEPKECLLTFVEIFVLKFLSDNLAVKILPDSNRFNYLLEEPKKFQDLHGVTAIEYYVTKIRPFIKSIFPDNTVVVDGEIAKVFGLSTLVSKTSIINGFAFLKSSTVTLAGFNRTFLDILKRFEEFGPLTTIEPEFKIRLYETFLRRSARQQKLGQFFTPRNVVKPMIRMAQLDKLKDNSVVLDPAAGVGGFILEPTLLIPGLKGNAKFSSGKCSRKIKFIGVDVDANTHILAKANTLLHFAEAVRDPSITMGALNQLMAETFVLMNRNETLGALVAPPQMSVDIILTNPPYVTRGSGVYKDEVKEHGVGENGVDLKNHYDRAGLGVESLFLRYIVEALKAGGRAFVVVPLGLLNRTDPGFKKSILKKCNLLASIALPRNTFFNTAQLTYILALEKRHSEADPRPEVFCGIAGSIGESLDWERIPSDKNDLATIAESFVSFSNANSGPAISSKIVKIASPTEFTENDRWDVTRFWSDKELVDLGHKESAVSRLDFIDEVSEEILEINSELKTARTEIQALTSGLTTDLSIGDDKSFKVRSGTRVTGEEIRDNPGEIPVYSCFKTDREIKGLVDKKFFTKVKGGVIEKNPIVTVNANGASVGHVYVRRNACAITDDVIIVECLRSDLDIDYLSVALQSSVDKGGFLYEAKLFAARVKELEITIPIGANGLPDIAQQRLIATAIRRFNSLRTRLHDLGVKCKAARAI